MNIIKYIILGIIQGLTEPLPISSSGHLLLFKNLFNVNMFNDLNFEIFANFGSFIAIFIIYYKDIFKLSKNSIKHIIKKDKKTYKKDFNYIKMIIISSIPVGIIGFIFKDLLEKIISIKLVGICLLITAISLLLIKNIKGNKKDEDIKIKDAIIIGLFQMLALIPGLSRSGMTLVGCILRNLNHETSLKYTFMLYFPVSLASFLLSLFDLGLTSNLLIPYLIGTLVSLIVTYFSFNWFKDILKKGKLWKFSIYCIIVGLFILFYFR